MMSSGGSSVALIKGNPHIVTRFHTLRSRFKSLNAKKKQVKRQRQKKQPSAPAPSRCEQINKTIPEIAESRDDIDDIFASIGEWHWTEQNIFLKGGTY